MSAGNTESPRAMGTSEAAHVLEKIEQLETRQGSFILKLSEPISNVSPQAADPQTGWAAAAAAADARASDVSNVSLDAPTPASLEADLAHYRELFAKLRFSYVEQVTKEKFIRAIVGDPPLIVSPRENADLEARNATAKAELKSLKAEVADLAAALGGRGRELSRRHEAVRAQAASLRELPGKLQAAEREIERLRAERQPTGSRPELGLPLERTLELVEARRRRRAELDRQLEQLGMMVPRKRKEADRLQAELQPLESKRQNSAAAAAEARRRKEAALGGAGDDLEERGGWWRASEAVLKKMLEA